MMDHLQTHTIRDTACLMNLQKLFRYYFYSSSFRFDSLIFNDHAMSKYETLLLPLFSTESTAIFPGASRYERIKRAEIVSAYPPAYRYLNVCVAHARTGEIRNCSVCEKCLRTQLTFDLLGKLDLFKDVFETEKYRGKRKRYIGLVLAEKHHKIMYGELMKLMKKVNAGIPVASYLFSLSIMFKRRLIRFIRRIYPKKQSGGN
jgi:hypothetical protein